MPVEREGEVGDHVGPVLAGERDQVEGGDLVGDGGLGNIGQQPPHRMVDTHAAFR